MTDKGKDIVVNTSPWIALSTCGQIDLLKKLYVDVYVPYVQKILERGIWIKDEIVEGILKESGEKS